MKKSFSEQASEMDEKLIDLEARSMRDNLMFYGINEGGDHENCGELVRNLCADVLHIEMRMTLCSIWLIGWDTGHRKPARLL